MHVYFCPICGRIYEAREAVCRTWGRLAYAPGCPVCDVALHMRGKAFLLSGVFLVFPFIDLLFFLQPIAYPLAVMFFWCWMVVGLMRVVRRSYAVSRTRLAKMKAGKP